MSIANELSCEVAAAVFAARPPDTGPDTEQLGELVLTLHTTLRRLTDEARHRRRAQRLARNAAPAQAATPGGH
ncbi:MAG TPA: hypothetical protein VF546_19615 [Pyrinomonadaceae bacterium]|jgi:hypothetical protein